MSKPRAKAPEFVSTVWFEPSGRARHTPCKREAKEGRVRLRNLETGVVQADLTAALYQTLLSNGLVRPLDEVPTLPTNKRTARLKAALAKPG